MPARALLAALLLLAPCSGAADDFVPLDYPGIPPSGPVDTALREAEGALLTESWERAEEKLAPWLKKGDLRAEVIQAELVKRRDGMERALDHFRKVALKGSLYARYELGAYFLEAYLKDRNPALRQEAFKWIRAGAHGGEPRALFLAAYLTHPDDRQVETRRLQETFGAPKLDGFPRFLAARYLLTGERGDERRDARQALEQLEALAEGEHRGASLLLARLYSRREIDPATEKMLSAAGVRSDLHAAVRWAEQAAGWQRDELAGEAQALLNEIRPLLPPDH